MNFEFLVVYDQGIPIVLTDEEYDRRIEEQTRFLTRVYGEDTPHMFGKRICT